MKLPLSIKEVTLDDTMNATFVVDADGLTVNKDTLVAYVNQVIGVDMASGPDQSICSCGRDITFASGPCEREGCPIAPAPPAQRESGTPRTDAAISKWRVGDGKPTTTGPAGTEWEIVDANFARQLERENEQLQRELAEAQSDLAGKTLLNDGHQKLATKYRERAEKAEAELVDAYLSGQLAMREEAARVCNQSFFIDGWEIGTTPIHRLIQDAIRTLQPKDYAAPQVSSVSQIPEQSGARPAVAAPTPLITRTKV